ncbi:hypothetical protein [Longimicrobium sp.]|uniref:hypothetical protein n=1 Tax=Longimicrobium sp. TaxID=2029185 RepID=UPI002C9017D5|nr:hypothetical protein [Longimicrobium sp.]HSU16765.1 hypothetical protein [Longimicrobium sp.]
MDLHRPALYSFLPDAEHGFDQLPLSSREYKLLLSTTRFHERDPASREWMKPVGRAIGVCEWP